MVWNISPRLLKAEPLQRCKLHDCNGACCLYGVWLGLQEVERILQNTDLIRSHLLKTNRERNHWFEDEIEMDEFLSDGKVRHSVVVESPQHYGGTACIFWGDGGKCALQTAAIKAGLHPWTFKPFYCILHPLDLDTNGLITLDTADLLAVEEGSCLREAEHPIPLLETFETELRYFLGDQKYEFLLKSLE
jgi:hypothetical protein